MIQRSASLEYAPSSVPLHISAKQLFSDFLILDCLIGAVVREEAIKALGCLAGRDDVDAVPLLF